MAKNVLMTFYTWSVVFPRVCSKVNVLAAFGSKPEIFDLISMKWAIGHHIQMRKLPNQLIQIDSQVS